MEKVSHKLLINLVYLNLKTKKPINLIPSSVNIHITYRKYIKQSITK